MRVPTGAVRAFATRYFDLFKDWGGRSFGGVWLRYEREDPQVGTDAVVAFVAFVAVATVAVAWFLFIRVLRFSL